MKYVSPLRVAALAGNIMLCALLPTPPPPKKKQKQKKTIKFS